MKIKISCPICRAKNNFSQEQQICRRCGEDLSLLYQVKAYSYKYRVILIYNWKNGAQHRRFFLKKATDLVNMPE